MATFYGQVFGNGRTPATRGGTYASGLRTSAQSYQGSVVIELTQPEDEDGNRTLMVEVQVSTGSSSRGKVVYYGDLSEFCYRLGGLTCEDIEKEGW